MSSLNKVLLIGRLGKDPEIRYMPNNDPVATFSLATSESWKDKNTGDKQERTEWHNIVLYRGLAQIAQQYLRKGNQVYISGRIQSRRYTGKDNIERLYYEIIGNELVMLGSKNDSINNNYQANDENTFQNNNYNQASSYQGNNMNNQNFQNTNNNHQFSQVKHENNDIPVPNMNDLDDDIPF